MKTGKSLSDWAHELERQANAKKDVVADSREINMVTPVERADSAEEMEAEEARGLTLSIGNAIEAGSHEQYDIQDTAHRQLGERTGIPAKYYDRMREEAPGLLADNVNNWLHSDPRRRMVRMLDGNARAILSDRYQRIDNWDVAETALPILREVVDLSIQSCEITERRMYLKAVSPRVRGEVTVGQEVQAGVVISNSEIGHGSVNIQPMVFELICLNGMIRPSALRKYHVGAQVEAGELEQLFTDKTKKAEDSVTLMKIRDVIQGVLDADNFQEYIESLRETKERKITGNPVKAIETLGKAQSLTEGEQGGVLRHLIEGGDLSQWGVIRAVTRSSQDVADYDRATELEQLGGKLVDLSPDQWQTVAEAA